MSMDLGTAEAVQVFPDGSKKASMVTIRKSFHEAKGMKRQFQPWFEFDKDWYLWPAGTRRGTMVLYRPSPSRHPYHELRVTLKTVDAEKVTEKEALAT